jgi:hypothetical protein
MNVSDFSIYTNGYFYANLQSPVVVFHDADELLLRRLNIKTTRALLSHIFLNPVFPVPGIKINSLNCINSIVLKSPQFNKITVSDDVDENELMLGLLESKNSSFSTSNMNKYDSAIMLLYQSTFKALTISPKLYLHISDLLEPETFDFQTRESIQTKFYLIGASIQPLDGPLPSLDFDLPITIC